MATAKQIQYALERFTQNHRYALANTYVFDWESDFFSVTTSGHVYEFEIKITKSDFKKDFEKPKHKYLAAMFADKTHVVSTNNKMYGWGKDKSNLITRAKHFQLHIDGVHYRRNPTDINFIDAEDSFGYWMKDENISHLTYHFVDYHAPFTDIRIDELGKYLMPGKFFYVCPENLLTADDMPPYAGLIWYYPSGYTRIKKPAPLLHNKCMEGLDRILRDKFYWLSVNQQRQIDKLKWLLEDYYREQKEKYKNL